MDYYKVLGVKKDATGKTIHKAFRERSKECHPDKGGDPKEFHDVATAYEILSNEETRKEYDETGEVQEKKDAVQAAKMRIMEIANQWICKTSPGQITAKRFLDSCESTIDNAESHLRKALSDESVKIEKLEMLLNDLTYSEDDYSPAHSIFQDEITSLKRKISEIETELSILEIIRTIIDNYNYPKEKESSTTFNDILTEFSPVGNTSWGGI